jgi:hypothetical protein
MFTALCAGGKAQAQGSGRQMPRATLVGRQPTFLWPLSQSANGRIGSCLSARSASSRWPKFQQVQGARAAVGPKADPAGYLCFPIRPVIYLPVKTRKSATQSLCKHIRRLPGEGE